MATRQQIVECARTWLGTPFKHQGRLKGKGADCAGLVVGVGKELGLTNYDTTNYGRLPNSGEMEKILDNYLEQIPVSTIQPGDVLFFRFEGDPQHVAIVTDIGIIHNYALVRRCVEHSLDPTWRSRIVKAYRYPGVE